MKKIVLTLFAAALALGAGAASVSPERAMAAANAWAARNGAFGAGLGATNVVTECDAEDADVVLWHQVSMAGGGMLVVAPVTEIEPVVMALDNDPGVLPEAHPLKGILRGDMRRRLQFLGLYPQGGVAVQARRTVLATVSTTADDSSEDGTDGAAGTTSENGTGDENGTDGESGTDGENGTTSATGTTGEDGTDNADGTDSTAGTDGEDGTGADDVAKAWGAACEAKWARLAPVLPPGLKALPSAVSAEEVAVEVCVAKGFEKGGALTHWNQGSYGGGYLYNLYTPGHVVCGCVATACAALAQFYGTTNAAAGLVNADCRYKGAPYAAKTLGGPIDWSILPENWGGAAASSTALTAEQRQLIGRVAFDAGVGVGMMWDDGASSAYMSGIVAALKDVFGFRHARRVLISDEENPPQEELEKLIYNQCRAGAPVGMGILGHAVLATGYGLDADGVERVRVFMGWAGLGDGWYALPKIDTKATEGGASYLSEIVDEVITMIAYDSDDIVPVVGHVTAPGAALEIAGLGRTLTAGAEGHFGTRVPADMGICTLTCMGKTAEIAIDAGAGDDALTKVADLCPLLPEAFEFVLMNCTVAYSLERAKLYALKEGKAILRVNGVVGEADTTAALDYIYGLDRDNVDGFADRFVYVFSQAGSSAGDGADLSYGVYLPSAVDPADRWQAKNGALAYGYSTALTTLTNVTHDASHEAEANGLDEVETTRVVTYTFAPIDGTPELSERDEDDAEAIEADILASLARVLGVGARRFAECTSGIAVTIAATSPAAEEAINAAADPAQACGLHENSYTSGPYTFTCDAVVTNEAAGVALGCAGWTATNATTGAVLAGAGSSATLELAANDEVTLTWDFSKTNAVYVTVVPQCANGSGGAGDYDVAPGSGWYAWNEAVLFTATSGEDYAVSNWVLHGGTGLGLGAAAYVLFADAPGQLDVNFRKGGAAAEETEKTVTVTATSWLVVGGSSLVRAAADAAPASAALSAAGTFALASGEAVEVPVVLDAVVQAGGTSFVDGAGATWTLRGYVAAALDGTESPEALLEGAVPRASLTLQDVFPEVFPDGGDAAVSWIWTSDGGGEVQTSFAIKWDDALSTLNAHGYSTNLTTVAALAAQGLTTADITVTAPKGFKAKVAADDAGNVVATLELDEAALRPVAADGTGSPLTIFQNGDGALTVKAAVANGVRGFWYALYAADELGGAWQVVAAGYEAGTPTVQALADDAAVEVAIDVVPTEAKKFYRLVVSDVKP